MSTAGKQAMKFQSAESARLSASSVVPWAFFAPLLIAMTSWFGWRFTGVPALALIAQGALGVTGLIALGLIGAAFFARRARRDPPPS